MTGEFAVGEVELRALCGRLVAGHADADDRHVLATDLAVREEVVRRLAVCGCRLHLPADAQAAPVIVVDDPHGGGLGTLPLACLAVCAIALDRPVAQGKQKPRLTVRELWERVGRAEGVSQPHVRRLGVGPLEQRGLVRLVKPAQSARDAYLVAGPALAAVDVDALRARLRSAHQTAA